jgi:hypothetical protein
LQIAFLRRRSPQGRNHPGRVFGTRPAQVILIRDRAQAGYDLALATAEPSTADMIAKLRRVLIAARYQPARPGEPTPAEIYAVRLVWEGAVA